MLFYWINISPWPIISLRMSGRLLRGLWRLNMDISKDQSSWLEESFKESKFPSWDDLVDSLVAIIHVALCTLCRLLICSEDYCSIKGERGDVNDPQPQTLEKTLKSSLFQSMCRFCIVWFMLWSPEINVTMSPGCSPCGHRMGRDDGVGYIMHRRGLSFTWSMFWRTPNTAQPLSGIPTYLCQPSGPQPSGLGSSGICRHIRPAGNFDLLCVGLPVPNFRHWTSMGSHRDSAPLQQGEGAGMLLYSEVILYTVHLCCDLNLPTEST